MGLIVGQISFDVPINNMNKVTKRILTKYSVYKMRRIANLQKTETKFPKNLDSLEK